MRGRGQFFPVCGRGESIEIKEATAVQRGVGDSQDPTKSQQGFVVDFIPTQQIRIIAKIPEKPVELPQGLLRAIQAAVQKAALMLFRFENCKTESEKRPLRVPAVEYPLNLDEKDAVQDIVTIVAGVGMQSRNFAFHCVTSCGLR